MKRVTYKDYPTQSPCNTCGIEKWEECYGKPEACQELWNFLAQRGDWVMEENQRRKLIANRPELLPPKQRYVKNSSGIRNSK